MNRRLRVIAAPLLALLFANAAQADAGRSMARKAVDAGLAPRARTDAGASKQRLLDAGLAPRADAAVPIQAANPASAQGPAPTSADLGTILRELSKIEALSARFREEKRMALLAQPLISEGALHYERPRRLARHTERPRKSSLVLEGDVLSFGDAKRSESLGVSSQPALALLVETFVSVLAGDRAALERVAEVKLESIPDGFRILVTPRDAKVKRLVHFMAFEGQGATLTRMELLDATGDRSVTTFSAVTLRKRFAEGERARLFRIGG